MGSVLDLVLEKLAAEQEPSPEDQLLDKLAEEILEKQAEDELLEKLAEEIVADALEAEQKEEMNKIAEALVDAYLEKVAFKMPSTGDVGAGVTKLLDLLSFSKARNINKTLKGARDSARIEQLKKLVGRAKDPVQGNRAFDLIRSGNYEKAEEYLGKSYKSGIKKADKAFNKLDSVGAMKSQRNKEALKSALAGLGVAGGVGGAGYLATRKKD